MGVPSQTEDEHEGKAIFEADSNAITNFVIDMESFGPEEYHQTITVCFRQRLSG